MTGSRLGVGTIHLIFQSVFRRKAAILTVPCSTAELPRITILGAANPDFTSGELPQNTLEKSVGIVLNAAGFVNTVRTLDLLVFTCKSRFVSQEEKVAHANLVPQLHTIVDGQISYKRLDLGDVLDLFALDAETRKHRSFRIEVIGFEEAGYSEKMPRELCPSPVFRFQENLEPFHLFGADRASPLQIAPGLIAQAGMSGAHVPEFHMHRVGFCMIGIARDYSFEYVGGTEDSAFAADIQRIQHLRPYQKPNVVAEAAAFLEQVKRIRMRKEG